MHWPPTDKWTAALQPYSLFVLILQRCETGDSIGLYSVSECKRKLLMGMVLFLFEGDQDMVSKIEKP